MKASGCLVAAVMIVGLVPSKAIADDALAQIKRRGVLRWGGDVQGGEPYAFLDPRDPSRIIGFEVEIADLVAADLGVRAEFVQNAWSTLEPSLERGDFDIILNGYEETPTRRERFALSRPYYRYGERLTVRSGTRALTLDDLKGHRVATLASTFADDLLRQHGADVVLYEGVEEPYLDLAAGRVDAVMLEDVIADRYQGRQPGLVAVGGDVAIGAYVIASRKGEPALASAVDASLARIAERGDLARILVKWGLWNANEMAIAPLPGLSGPTPQGPAAGFVPDRDRSSPEPAGRSPMARQSGSDPTRLFLGGQGLLFLRGAAMTLLVSILAMALAVPLGLGLALARRHGGPALAGAAAIYVEVWRGTPVLLQLYLLYYGLSSVVRLGALPAAIIGLGLNYAAYEAEVYRGALMAVPLGQSEAASALGLSTFQTLRHVVLPQAFRVALPAVTNDFVALLKDSSLVSVITVVELTKQMTITAVDVRSWVAPGIACAGLYLAMSWPLARLAGVLERRLAHA